MTLGMFAEAQKHIITTGVSLRQPTLTFRILSLGREVFSWRERLRTERRMWRLVVLPSCLPLELGTFSLPSLSPDATSEWALETKGSFLLVSTHSITAAVLLNLPRDLCSGKWRMCVHHRIEGESPVNTLGCFNRNSGCNYFATLLAS